MSNHDELEVTSSCLCKKVEGAGFPFQVKSLEDGIDDAIRTFYVHRTHHGSGAASDFDKAALEHVSGAQFAPQVAGDGEEREQLGHILLQPPDHAGLGTAP